MTTTMASAPTSDVTALVDRVRESTTSLRIIGAGQWLDAGRPVATDAPPLPLAQFSGVVEYVPGDLVITVGAATTLAELDRITAEHGQWCGLDPFGSDAGSVGATIATASIGPLSMAHGAPRDQLLGLHYITGDGTVATAGGRVVKNVAGFDVVRLQCGAWGTLGVLTEITLRCFARPTVDDTMALPLPAAPLARAELLDTLRSSALAPLAMVLLDATMSARAALPPAPHVVLRLGGNAPSVAAQRALCATLGDLQQLPTSVWQQLRAMDDEATAVARVSARPARLDETWAHVARALETAGVPAHTVRRVALADRGMVRVAIDGAHDAVLTALIAHLAPAGGATRWERLPPSCWPFVRSETDDALSQRVRRAFDPSARLNRGILGPLLGTVQDLQGPLHP
jgi:FAD/FMN-containing dehydrogenase